MALGHMLVRHRLDYSIEDVLRDCGIGWKDSGFQKHEEKDGRELLQGHG